MGIKVNQKLVLYIHEGEIKAGWMLANSLQTMLDEGFLIPAEITETQAASVIDAVSKKLKGE